MCFRWGGGVGGGGRGFFGGGGEEGGLQQLSSVGQEGGRLSCQYASYGCVWWCGWGQRAVDNELVCLWGVAKRACAAWLLLTAAVCRVVSAVLCRWTDKLMGLLRTARLHLQSRLVSRGSGVGAGVFFGGVPVPVFDWHTCCVSVPACVHIPSCMPVLLTVCFSACLPACLSPCCLPACLPPCLPAFLPVCLSPCLPAMPPPHTHHAGEAGPGVCAPGA